MVIVGSVKISSNPNSTSTMSTSQNINARTVAPVVNLELVPVDSDLEEDLKEIQCKAAAKQAWIEEAMKAKIAAAHEHIEKKRRERKVEEARKAEEEEERKQKEEEARKAEEDKVVREKAQKRQLEVHSSTSLIFYES